MAEKDQKLNMAERRKQIKALYSSEDHLKNLLEKSVASRPFTREEYDRLLGNITGKGRNIKEIIQLSEKAYSINKNYSGVIDYLANMFLWRYFYIPVKKRDTDLNLRENYDRMSMLMDGLNIKVMYPTILTKLFVEGAVYLYAVKDESSKTISILTLPSDFCQPVMVSQYGTGIYTFNVKYFDSFGLRAEQLADFLLLFPKEIAQGYLLYKEGKGPAKIQLDGRYASYIQMNEYKLPGYIGMLDSILNYADYKDQELIRNDAELDNILIHKIPIYDDRPIFELPEVEDLHSAMARAIAGNTRLRLLTTFGETKIEPVQSRSSVQNDTIRKALEAIYYDSGLNNNLFSGATKDGIEASIKRDTSFVMKYVDQLTNFYNLTINNLFKFGGYELEFTIIPVTHYNLEKTMELYRRNSEFGVGKLELVVASGTRQEHIEAKAEIEDLLNLDEILIPLRSSHTRSGKEEEEEEKKPEKEEEIEIETNDEPEEQDSEESEVGGD